MIQVLKNVDYNSKAARDRKEKRWLCTAFIALLALSGIMTIILAVLLPLPDKGSSFVPNAGGKVDGLFWQNRMEYSFNEPSSYVLGNHNSHDGPFYKDDYWHDQGFGTHPFQMSPENAYFDGIKILTKGDELVLKVNGNATDLIKSAQIATTIANMEYGTFRAWFQLPKVPGTCVGFFFYHNETQEIDIEYLGNRPDILWLSTKNTIIDSVSHINYQLNDLSTGWNIEDYHELRFDWLPEETIFYVNGVNVGSIPSPFEAGSMLISHWANGDDGWSGYPYQDAFLKVRNVSYSFNTTDLSLESANASLGAPSGTYGRNQFHRGLITVSISLLLLGSFYAGIFNPIRILIFGIRPNGYSHDHSSIKMIASAFLFAAIVIICTVLALGRHGTNLDFGNYVEALWYYADYWHELNMAPDDVTFGFMYTFLSIGLEWFLTLVSPFLLFLVSLPNGNP